MSGTTAIVKGGLFEQYGSTVSSISVTEAGKRRAAQALSQKGQWSLRERAETLNGVAPGAPAVKTNARVQASEELGGKRVIENEVLVNRNTTTADQTELNDDVFSLSNKTTFGSNPPANKDGNPLDTR